MASHERSSEDPTTDEVVVQRELIATLRGDMRVVQEILEKLDKTLFGNGQPGVIQQLQSQVNRHERYFWIGAGIFVAVKFFTEQGAFTLKALIGH